MLSGFQIAFSGLHPIGVDCSQTKEGYEIIRRGGVVIDSPEDADCSKGEVIVMSPKLRSLLNSDSENQTVFAEWSDSGSSKLVVVEHKF